MKKRLAKKIAIGMASVILLASTGAFGADMHKCKAGEKWDATAKTCIKASK